MSSGQVEIPSSTGPRASPMTTTAPHKIKGKPKPGRRDRTRGTRHQAHVHALVVACPPTWFSPPPTRSNQATHPNAQSPKHTTQLRLQLRLQLRRPSPHPTPRQDAYGLFTLQPSPSRLAIRFTSKPTHLPPHPPPHCNDHKQAHNVSQHPGPRSPRISTW